MVDAPRDGTRVLIYGVPTYSYYFREESFWGKKEFPLEFGEGYFSAGLWQFRGGIMRDPLGWMPLPLFKAPI